MKCHICHQGPPDGPTIYRMNATGVPGIWACKAHATQPIDPELLAVVRDLEDVIAMPMTQREAPTP